MPPTNIALHINRNITTVSQEVLADNRQRSYALLVNDSDSVIYLALGKPAIANEGIRLNASGGSYEINATNLWRGRVYAISTAATKKLMVTEW